MNTSLVRSNGRRYYLPLLFLFLISLIIFVAVSGVSGFDTFIMVTVGLGLMGLALYNVAISSSQPLASIGVWFTGLLVLQHGVGWILQQIFGERHYSRVIYYTDYSLAKAVALAGLGLFVFSVAYYYYHTQRRKMLLKTNYVKENRLRAVDKIPWFVLLLWLAGFLFFEWSGGMNMLVGFDTTIYVLRSFFGYLSKMIILLISIKLFASKFQTRTVFVLLVILWGGFVFLTGQRQYVVGISITAFIFAYKWRLRIFSFKELVQLGAFLLAIMIGMVFLRDIFGRTTFTNLSLSEQLEAMSTITIPAESDTLNTLQYELGYRLNGSNILLGLLSDLPEVDMFWADPVYFSAVAVVPNLVWSNKASVILHNLPREISNHYGISNKGDYIVTYITVFYAMGGIPMLMILAGLFGLLISSFDISFARTNSVFGVIMGIGLVYGLVSVDHSIDQLFLAIRDSFLLYIVVAASMIFTNIPRMKWS